METINIEALIGDITQTANAILGKDITIIRGFSSRQINNIAHQTALVSSGIVTGQIAEDNREFFLSQLVELVKSFVHTLVGLMMATIEKLWNSIVNVLWKTIAKATGISLETFKLL